MKTLRLLIIGLLFICIPPVIQGGEVIILQTGWKFAKGPNEKAYLPSFNDSRWQEVNLPHDWAIEGPVIVNGDGSTGKLPWKGEGWYRKKMMIPAEYKGKEIYLLCDGIMAFPEIYINGTLAGRWDYGYSSFYVDITPYLKPGRDNVIAVHADTRNHESRWYPGAGIYRKIQMIVMNPVHINIWGTWVSTPVIKSGYARIRIISSVNNQSSSGKDVRIENIIYAPNGMEIARTSGRSVLQALQSRDIETTAIISNPEKWDVDHPVLYKVKTIVYLGTEVSDSSSLNFGIRKVNVTADNGLCLNDRRVQIKGVDLHHDQGLLGAAFNVRAAERQLEIMKSMGCNAIRTSHNPPAPELLDLCDKMGFLVFDEICDKWDKTADITDSTHFDEYAGRNVRNFVLRDRNHPSVFIWSAGNEISDAQNNTNDGFSHLQTMVNCFRKYDLSRQVTMACDDRKSIPQRAFDFYDVHSWNYGRKYVQARQLDSHKGVIISESSSAVSTRGFYELPFPVKKTDFTSSLQVSSFDLNAPLWAEIPDDDFMWQQEDDYVAGEFVWTGFDYLGEPTPYDNLWTNQNKLGDSLASRISYFGIVDLCGIPKDRYYLYKSYWKPDETTVHILPHWNWDKKAHDTMPVFVYTNGDCAELSLNGKSY
ncbi:MAG: glycoside hydrolase family 2 TIM barrel-domain containing protein, partial [Bacteroidota bacterium]|nr:glycoside hydrolase family 2 TIM barrel-domain containing protein [Bacteroidota bacterium]